jgi:hypothetical protein
MKKYISFLSIPALNVGTIVYAQLPALDLFEEILKLLLLLATFIFTIVRIYILLRNKQKEKDTS